MSVSVRSYLMAGAAAATATAVVLTPLRATPADIEVPAHTATAAQPQLSQAMVDLLAAASRMTVALPVPTVPHASGAPVRSAAPAAAVTAGGDVTVQNAASDWLTGAYTGIQDWVDWGVNYASDIAYWLGGWGVPFAGLIGAQIDIFYFSLIRPISDNIFYGLVVPVVNDPLNIFVWANGIGNAIVSSIDDVINFGIQEFNYFFGWILPPLPGPPPIALAATTDLPTSALPAATDEGSQPVDFVTETVTGGISLAFQSLADVGEHLTDALQKGLGIEGDLLAGSAVDEGTALTDVVEAVTPADELTPPDTVDSAVQGVAETLDETVETVTDNVEKHVAEVTGTVTQDDTGSVTDVPKSVRQSLNKPDDTTESKPARSLTRAVRDATGKVAADVKKTADNVRTAVRNAGSGITGKKSQESTSSEDKADTKTETKNDADKPAKNKTETSSAKSDE